MRQGGGTPEWGHPRRRPNRWLRATVASIGLLAILCACAPARPSGRKPSQRLSALPTLSVHRQLIPPADFAYPLDRASRHPEVLAATIPTVTPIGPGGLRFRIVGAYPVRALQLGAFTRVDAHGLPVDGGDQFDCFAGSSACTADVRAGSIDAAVVLSPSARLVLVRETASLPGGGTVDVVGRFRTGSR